MKMKKLVIASLLIISLFLSIVLASGAYPVEKPSLLEARFSNQIVQVAMVKKEMAQLSKEG